MGLLLPPPMRGRAGPQAPPHVSAGTTAVGWGGFGIALTFFFNVIPAKAGLQSMCNYRALSGEVSPGRLDRQIVRLRFRRTSPAIQGSFVQSGEFSRCGSIS